MATFKTQGDKNTAVGKAQDALSRDPQNAALAQAVKDAQAGTVEN